MGSRRYCWQPADWDHPTSRFHPFPVLECKRLFHVRFIFCHTCREWSLFCSAAGCCNGLERTGRTPPNVAVILRNCLVLFFSLYRQSYASVFLDVGLHPF